LAPGREEGFWPNRVVPCPETPWNWRQPPALRSPPWLPWPPRKSSGYRDPESQAFIESWFGKLKEREVWLNEYETLDDARRRIGGYVDRYHHRPHSRLAYRTPREVAETWNDHDDQLTPAA